MDMHSYELMVVDGAMSSYIDSGVLQESVLGPHLNSAADINFSSRHTYHSLYYADHPVLNLSCAHMTM